MRNLFFRGCAPEVAATATGVILATGPAAADAAGKDAQVIELDGVAWPGLHDAHLHLEWLANLRLQVALGGLGTRRALLEKVRRYAERAAPGAWVIGRGWYNDDWEDDASWPTRAELDAVTGGRPALLVRKDGHSAWCSSAALKSAGITRETPDPEGGVIDREGDGSPAGGLRERAIELVRRITPVTTEIEFDSALEAVLGQLARLGLTSVHSMDSPRTYAALQRLHRRGRMRVRVTWNLPYTQLEHAERLGLQSGAGDDTLRVWGVKAFLDGSLGSRTAEMLGGGGVAVLTSAELTELAQRCADARLNIAWHAIGDGAVRRALDVLEPMAGAWALWRPRIEHAQCVHPADIPRFAKAGVIASMQPIHAVADRELVDREWAAVAASAYPWRALHAAGARLAFGSDAPVESADPIVGLDAATGWRRRENWFPELALDAGAARSGYTSGAAYAVGAERRVGRLRPGMLCDLTVVRGGRVAATVMNGRVTHR